MMKKTVAYRTIGLYGVHTKSEHHTHIETAHAASIAPTICLSSKLTTQTRMQYIFSIYENMLAYYTHVMHAVFANIQCILNAPPTP